MMIDFLLIDEDFKPYTRMTRRGKFVRDDALNYLSSQEGLKWVFKNTMQRRELDMLPEKTPLFLFARFILRRGHRSDLSNELKAVEDALQGIAFKDDRWIDKLDVERRRPRGDEQDKSLIIVGELGDYPKVEFFNAHSDYTDFFED